MTVRNSHTARLVTGVGDRLSAALSTSAVARTGRSVRNGAASAYEGSAFAGTAAWFGRAARRSWLYRWLTTEPEPDVVVIDLRETWTVGPVLGLLDRLLTPVARSARGSRARSIAADAHDTLAARPVQVASALVLVAVAASLALLLVAGTLPSSAVGSRLLVASLALAGLRVRASADDLAETRAFELLVALLEPPEPPDRDE